MFSADHRANVSSVVLRNDPLGIDDNSPAGCATTHTSVRQFNADIRAPRRCVLTLTAEQILASMGHHCSQSNAVKLGMVGFPFVKSRPGRTIRPVRRWSSQSVRRDDVEQIVTYEYVLSQGHVTIASGLSVSASMVRVVLASIITTH
jgi:hypothetical protein